MPERGGVGPASSAGWARLAAIGGDSDCRNGFVADIMGSYTHLSADLWLENLEGFNRLDPAVVVPAHGRLGDVGFIRRYRDYLESVRERVLARKRGGESLEQITSSLATSIAEEFSDLAPAAGNPAGRINAAIQAAYRLQ